MKIKETTAKIIRRFRSWLAENRHFLLFWCDEDADEVREPERSLLELPKDVQNQLINAVENLPSNPADIEAITTKIEEAFNRWREDPDNLDNCLIILSSPVTAVSRILSEVLEEWTQQQQVKLKLLPLKERPTDISTIKSKLEHYLSPYNSTSQQLETIVIPNLGWCFLRSLEGLEGIDYLQSLLGKSSSHRFWIIGTNHVGWEYLNCVYNFEAFCGEVFTLPGTAAERLSEWLDPVVNELEIIFDEPRLEKQVLDGDKDNKTHYFNSLASISQGVSTVAVRGFLESICYEQVEEDRDEEDTPKQKNTVIAETPKLPTLPTLESADQYILYSLLLHDDLDMSVLAESLGDDESQVQARVRVLRRQGVIEQKNGILRINPVHYPKLKQKLANNNFIVGRE